MNLTINNYDIKARRQNFTGTLDGVLTSTLRTLDTNDMANAVLLDVGSMVSLRTYYDAKNRNKQAGIETFFREISGTFINCLSAGLFAVGISHLIANRVMPNIKIRPDTWYSDDSVNVLHQAWKNADLSTGKYVKNVLENLSGVDGKQVNRFNQINWENIDWNDENSWKYITWQNEKYKNVPEVLKTKEGMIKTFADIIDDKNIKKVDKNNILKIMEARLINALGVERNLTVSIDNRHWGDKLENILRDTYDMGKDIFTNKNVDVDLALKKVLKLNKIKIFGALAGASALGLTNQFLNRKLTEKRTGKKGFVGDVGYAEKATADSNKVAKKDKFLLMKKLAASIGMVGMVLGVMKVKNPKDFVKKLQFTGPVTSGNAIKTVYASTIIGRFMAADNDTELRESVTRDYFGFLNWLVFGGFAAKGVANLIDRDRSVLFNTSKEGHGLKHWLNDLSLKTHAEIASKGKAYANKNLWKLNVAHVSGLLYSGLALGYLLPMLNDKMTKMRAKKQQTIKSLG